MNRQAETGEERGGVGAEPEKAPERDLDVRRVLRRRLRTRALRDSCGALGAFHDPRDSSDSEHAPGSNAKTHTARRGVDFHVSDAAVLGSRRSRSARSNAGQLVVADAGELDVRALRRSGYERRVRSRKSRATGSRVAREAHRCGGRASWDITTP